MNPIRFQGQYHDHETGLHYNRHRYYDPTVGRFISKDPLSYDAGLNLYQCAPNPTGWTDALGLSRKGTTSGSKKTNTAEGAADAAVAGGKTSGAASEFRQGDHVITGVSGEEVPHIPR
jgi:RHS repeat-associated protein